MEYLGQTIELVEQDSGWVSVWFHPFGTIQVGFFPSPEIAWTAVTELVRRDLAVRSLAELVDEWSEQQLLDPFEHSLLQTSLFGFVFGEPEPS